MVPTQVKIQLKSKNERYIQKSHTRGNKKKAKKKEKKCKNRGSDQRLDDEKKKIRFLHLFGNEKLDKNFILAYFSLRFNSIDRSLQHKTTLTNYILFYSNFCWYNQKSK